jgi:hypothetical protein
MINSNTFLYWACSKQLSYEGGFAGRTNKLVDGCYSFWQGGAIVIMNNYLQKQCDVEQEEEETDTSSSSSSNDKDDEWNKNKKVLDEEDETNGPTTLFDEYMLQQYILLCLGEWWIT